MKIPILRFALGLALGAALIFGQDGKKAGNRIVQELGLTDEQKPKVQAIMKEQREAMEAARAKNADRSEMRSIQAKTQEKLKGVLNEEQMKKYEEMRSRGSKRKRQLFVS